MNDDLHPKDHAEEIAIFRAQVLGPLLCIDVGKRELATTLRELSLRRYQPPQSKTTRTFAPSTLQRWYYRYRAHGLEGLRPQCRRTGSAQGLTDEQRKLLLAIRREHPSASVPLMLQTLIAEGRIDPGQASAVAIRRLLTEHGLDRRTLARLGKRERRRWQADRPGRLWHADVCHGPPLCVGERRTPLRIHAILDDASRYVVGISARSSEREVDMLDLFVETLRTHGKPDGLYLDNGSTYRGEALATACGRLGVGLVHASPYDPQARGKMERFWRTLREGCLDFLGERSTLHEVQVRLVAFLDAHYHHAPHAGLMGSSPGKVWAERPAAMMNEGDLHDALTVRARRQVRGDGTVSVGGIDWEVADGWLATHTVVVARTLADLDLGPWVEHEGERRQLKVVDPELNARRKRKSHRPKRGVDVVDFDPNRVRVQQVTGKTRGPK